MPQTLYLIDGYYMIFRAYHAPMSDLTSPAGEPTKAVHVFCSMLLKFLAEHRPTYLAVALDSPEQQLQRKEIFPEYKANRPPLPEDFPCQRDRILEIIRTMDLPVIEAPGYEADDVIATLADRLAGPEMDVVIVSRDKDLDQVLSDHVRLYDPMKEELIGPDELLARKGYTPAQAVEIQTLTGDSTDNIPGVKGVGPKTAVKLITQYGSAEEVLAHAEEQTPKLKENLLAASESLSLSRQLVSLSREVPLKIGAEDLTWQPAGGDRLRELFVELGMNRMIQMLEKGPLAAPSSPSDQSADGEIASAASPGPDAPTSETTAADFTYTCIDTPEALAELANRLSRVTRLAVDTETTDRRPLWCSLVGVSLAIEPGSGWYIPVKGPLGARTLPLETVRDALARPLAEARIEKVGHNLKYDLLVLQANGMPLAGPLTDTLLAAYVLDSQRMTYKLDALAAEMLGHSCIPIEELIGRGRDQVTMDRVPVELVTPYAAEDADVALRLADVLDRQVAEQGMSELLDQMEMPLVPVLAEMERVGIRVDPAALKRMEIELSKQADALRDRIIEAAGRTFNPDSPKQLGEVLFGDLKLPVQKKTKTGPSTDSGVLEDLAPYHDLPGLILDYRKLTKLLSTYLKALAECIHPETGRIHTSFHQHGTATGRLSSSDPNLQNIPIRTELGRQIRSAFVADEGFVLLSADYSQVELRVLAHLCQDETMLAAFRADQDIHATVAAEVFDVPLAEVTADQRARAKTVNFGIVYGQTAFGLARTLRISRSDAGQFINAYKNRFPKIDEFLQSCVAHAKQHGYVETMFGRRRTIREIDARNPQRRALAERLAINSVVQGSAADLIKRAMLHIARRIREEDRPSRMLLQIHDELVFEIPTDAVEPERKMIVEEMIGAIDMTVPLKVDTGVGPSWLEAK